MVKGLFWESLYSTQMSDEEALSTIESGAPHSLQLVGNIVQCVDRGYSPQTSPFSICIHYSVFYLLRCEQI